MVDAKLFDAAILVIEKAELYAKMEGGREFRGCSTYSVAQTLIKDEKLWGDEIVYYNVDDLSWKLFQRFMVDGRVRQSVNTGFGSAWQQNRWTTLDSDTWNMHFKRTF